MSLSEKIDVLDLVIDVLREHEKRLDELISRLEKIVEKAEGRGELKNLRRYYEPL